MKRALLLAGLLLASVSGFAVTPLWLRDVKISPDGSTIAFCYKGDIYTVPAAGGSATRLTTQDSHESAPIWSPDGSKIAFASDRYGSFDVFVMPAAGGNAKRLTCNSASETPSTFSPDGKSVVFSAYIQDPASSIQFASGVYPELYSVPVTGGAPVQILGTPAMCVNYSPKGNFFVYEDVKGPESEFRKHHISSATRDIWRYDIATGKHTNLTNRPGEDLNPVMSGDGKTVYFLSEPAGTTDGHPTAQGWTSSINVFSFPISKPDELTQVSKFSTHPVRFLSRGGNTLCYTWNGEIYTQQIGADPKKVEIALVRDDENKPEDVTLRSGARSAAVSPDGKQIAFTVRGNVFVTSVEYGTTKQVTSTPQAENGVCFGKDNRSIIYSSDRDGYSQLYIARIARDEDPNFPNATLINEEPFLHQAGVERSDPSYSPDGKEVAFIQDRQKLMVANIETGAIRQITDESTWPDVSDTFSYDWSPDGKWFTVTFIGNGREPYSDIGIVSAQGGKITNITGSGYFSESPRFTADGNAILFTSERYGMRSHASWGSQDDAFLCFLNQDAYDKFRLSKEDYDLVKEAEKKADKKDEGKDKKEAKKDDKKKDIVVELEGIEDRIVRLTPNSSSLGGAILSQDGESLYYLASFEGGMDLWKMDVRKHETKLVSKDAGRGHFATDSTGKTIFLLGSSMKKMDGDKFKPVSYAAEMKIDHQAEREYMYEFVCREESKRFYTADMHNVDWALYTEAYRRFLPHINNNYDFSDLLSELLGELNVSHTGSGYRPQNNVEATASLGLLYDLKYSGEGMKVAEVLKGGPCDHANLKIAAGDIITHINGQAITTEQDLSVLMAGLAKKKTLVTVKGRGDMVIIPVTSGVQRDLMYNRWVKNRAAEVEKWSGGRLGYVHIKSMDDGSYRTVYSDILGKYNKCEGIVIDTRYNGGGRLHEDIEILFSGHKYLTQVIRGHESCDMPSRRWNKPSIMVTNEYNYSNAHGTPWVYRFAKIGKIVGAPVGGTMTSVNWVYLQDPSIYFGIPVIGYRTAEGYYLENTQLEPDILVLNTPEQTVKGEDAQLKAAVDELLKELDAAK